LESWLLSAAEEVELLVSDYGLNDTLKNLKRTTKSMDLYKNQDFTRFIKALVRYEAPSVLLLKKWLTDFQEGIL